MAKDTEKLIRQLSLISFLMAERRPVSALEIKQDVEGYSEMNDDAFARRFYADRAELEGLGISLKVEKPPEGYFEAELYTLPPENFYLPPIEFTDGELAALQTSLSLLDGRFAYAEPLRLALQQLSWGRPSPLGSAEQRSVAVAVTASAGGRELSQRLAKVETAISRRKTIEFGYYSIERDEHSKRKVDPYHLLYQGGQFYLVGYSHERDDIRVFRLSRIQRQDLLREQGRARLLAARRLRPLDVREPRRLAARRRRRRPPASGSRSGSPGSSSATSAATARWSRSRQSGKQWRAGSLRVPGPGVVFTTEYAERAAARRVGARPRRARPAARAEGARRRGLRAPRDSWSSATPASRTSWSAEPKRSAPARAPATADERRRRGRRRRARRQIRPERFARLIALAGILIQAARSGERIEVAEVRERLQLSKEELREDVDLLNVVNFGGGSYVLYAEIQGDEIEVDPEPYSDNFARPRAAAAARGEGAGGGDRPARRPPARGHPGLGARQDRRGARRRPRARGAPDRPHDPRRLRSSHAHDQRRDRREPAARARLLQGERGRVHQAQGRAVRADQRARGLVPVQLRPRPQATRATSGSTASSGRGCSTRRSSRGDEVDPTADLEGWPRTGARARVARRARVDLARARALGARAAARSSRSSPTAR